MFQATSETDTLALARLPSERRRALLRSVVFLAMAVALMAAGLFAVVQALHLHVDVDKAPLGTLLCGQVALVALTVVLPGALVALVTRDSPAAFGWGRPSRLVQLVAGVAGGVFLMTLLIGLIALLGGIRLTASPAPFRQILGYGAGYALLFGLTAISEEGLFRGYALFQLSRAISFWPAAIVMSLLFVAAHLGHKNETLLGLAQVGAFGLLMAFSVRKTEGLWFALGFHGAWDFTETFVYGVPDSGLASAGSLLTSHFSGPAWVTGGSVGPEGSVLVLPALAIMALLIHFGLQAISVRRHGSRE